jgi:hypothetical protein
MNLRGALLLALLVLLVLPVAAPAAHAQPLQQP